MAIGEYKGVAINPGSDADVAAQMAAIDKGSSTPTTTAAPTEAPAPQGGGRDAFVSELRGALMDQSGIISSSDSNIESSIESAIGGIRGANEANRARIESEYSRNRGYQMDRNATSEEKFLEDRTGYATSVVGFQNLREYNAKTIRDLDQRKNELLLQGDAQAASQIAALEIKKLEFEQEAAQRTFENILKMGTFEFAASADERADRGELRADRAQNFQEEQAKSAIALEYGLTLNKGETLESLVTRAMPLASEEKKLQLEQVRTAIAQNRAQTQAALASAARAAREDAPLDATNVELLAKAYIANPSAVVGLIKNPNQLGQVLNKAGDVSFGLAKDQIALNRQNGSSAASDIAAINENPNLSPSQKGELIKFVGETYPAAPRGGGFSSYPAAANTVAESITRAQVGFGNWLLGL